MQTIRKVFHLLCCMVVLTAVQQPVWADTATDEKTISGIVSDESGLPLMGVVVSVDGTTTGTITDETGSFNLEVPAESSVRVSCMGYQTQVFSVAGQD